MRDRWLAALILAACATATTLAGMRLEPLDAGRSNASPLMYLPNGKLLRVASLGQSALLADVVYLWAIQYHANYDRSDRYRYVEHVFGNVISELDPQYIDAYWMGALILTLEARDLEAGLRLLDKGMRENPDVWILPYLAGWECRFAGEFVRAAEYFDRATRIPGAPPAVRRMVAGMHKLAGDDEHALRAWTEVRDDPTGDPASVAIAERQVRDLLVRRDLEQLDSAVERYRSKTGKLPRSLDQMARQGYVDRVPQDPDGAAYLYDPVSGKVTSAAGRVLGDR